MSSSTATTVIFVALFGFMMWRRYKRTFGKQEWKPRPLLGRAIVMTLIAGVLTALNLTPAMLGAEAAGALLGAGLGLIGLRNTRYEVTPEKTFYTPSGWVGLAVTALFLGRMSSRFVSVVEGSIPAVPFSDSQKSPLTLGIFLLVVAYNVTIGVGVYREGKRLKALPAAPPPGSSPAAG